MDDLAYDCLFSRPRMVRDLLTGFAASDWNAEFDSDSHPPLTASYVSHGRRPRHADLVWRLRFRDERSLYVVLLLEFQSAFVRSMAVRMLPYMPLLPQKLIVEGVLRQSSVLPPVLPVLIYSGPRPWAAPVDVAELVAPFRAAAFARNQPSQRSFVLDGGRVGGPDPVLWQLAVGIDCRGDEFPPAASPGVARAIHGSATEPAFLLGVPGNVEAGKHCLPCRLLHSAWYLQVCCESLLRGVSQLSFPTSCEAH